MKKIICAIICSISLSLAAQTCVETYAGNGLPNLVNGSVAIAQFRNPSGICRDKFGNLYIADGDNAVIRKVSNVGVVSTYAGTGVPGFRDGTSDSAQFDSPFDICVDDSGNVYVSDFNNQRIRKIDVHGLVSTLAGNGLAAYVNGQGDTASFNYPRGIVWSPSGELFIGDSWNHRIRKINLRSGMVSTFAGGGNVMGVGSVGALVDAADSSARFYTPCGLSIDTALNIYVADAYNHRIRKINPAALVTSIAGSGASGTTAGSFVDGDISIAQFNVPTEICWIKSKGLLIGDTYNNSVRMLDFIGQVSTVAGTGSPGFKDSCVSNLALLNHPRGIVANSNSDSIFVIDGNNHAIRLLYNADLPSSIANENLSPIYFVTQNESQIIIHSNQVLESATTCILIDALGRRQILPTFIHGQEVSIESAGMASGVYVLAIDLDGVTHYFKCMKI